MDFLTAAEIAKLWNISSRMAAYYCESGRIDGAVKKGKTWFIPVHSEKPSDKRRSKQRTQNIDRLKGKPYDSGIDKVYHTSDVYHNLGLTRETLRYYEAVGLIQPKRSPTSQYREFDLFDMSRLMAIDFFKKRGFSPNEIFDLLKSEAQEEYADLMHRKTEALRDHINKMEEMLRLLLDTERFCRSSPHEIGEFEIRELPAYYIQDAISSIASFEEYRDKVLGYLDTEQEDILSNMVRVLSFDRTGYKGSEMVLVKQAGGSERADDKVFLENGRSLYTTFFADNNDPSIMEKMFAASHQWAAEHELEFRGVTYIFIRLVMLGERNDRNFYEVWIPLK